MSETTLAYAALGITDPTQHDASMAQAYLTLTGIPRAPAEIRLESEQVKRRAGITPSLLTQSDKERYWSMAAVEQTLTGHPKNSTPYTSWMDYRSMISWHGRRANGQARALLLGAATSLSTRAFVTIARMELGANQAHVVDLTYGRDKARHGEFVRANLLELPYRDGCMDFALSDQLIHMLRDPGAPKAPREATVRRLFGEIGRVLAPGGQVLMTELNPGVTVDVPPAEIERRWPRFAGFLRSVACEQGLECVSVEPCLIAGDTTYLYAPGYASQPIYFGQSFVGANLYARKPERRVHELSAAADQRRILALGATAAYTADTSKPV